MAVIAPPVTVSDTLMETFTGRATAFSDPNIQAEALSFAFAPSYQLNEPGSHLIYLPVTLREGLPTVDLH